jgi:hypothetical protein
MGTVACKPRQYLRVQRGVDCGHRLDSWKVLHVCSRQPVGACVIDVAQRRHWLRPAVVRPECHEGTAGALSQLRLAFLSPFEFPFERCIVTERL